jgi:hypothetical protein
MPTNRERFLKKHKLPMDTSLSLKEISTLSGMPFSALKMVYNKGLGAYHTNPTSVRLKGSFKKNVNAPMSQKLSPQQWGMGRVFAFVMKTPKVFYDADKHIAEMYDLF